MNNGAGYKLNRKLPPKYKSTWKQVSFRIPPELKRMIAVMAVWCDKPWAAIARDSMVYGLLYIGYLQEKEKELLEQAPDGLKQQLETAFESLQMLQDPPFIEQVKELRKDMDSLKEFGAALEEPDEL